jgi:flavodoxin
MLNREELIAQYAECIVEGMDVDTLVAYAMDQLMEGLRTYTDEDLTTEIEDFYPELLENN